jgi:glycosyltransferase involved in cell wall biosynthesis
MSQIALSDMKVKVVQFRCNFGKAAALQTGFNLTSGDIVFTLDGDLQVILLKFPIL